MPVGVHPGRGQHVHVDDPTALADLHRQRIRRQERVGPLVERSGAEVGDLGVQLAGHHTDLGLAQPGDPELLDQLLHPPGRHPQQVAGGDHTDQGPLGPLPAFQQPLREIGALPQLRNRQLDRAGPGVEVAGPVAVAGVGPLRAAGAVGGAARRVGLSPHQRLHEAAEHQTQHVGLGTLQVLGHQAGQVNSVVVGGHRDDLLLETLDGLLKDHAVAVFTSYDTLSGQDSYTTSLDLSAVEFQSDTGGEAARGRTTRWLRHPAGRPCDDQCR